MKIPAWYQELSNEQELLVQNLPDKLRNDALEIHCPQTSLFLDNLGIHPPLSTIRITACLEKSQYRPITFLKHVAQLLATRSGDKLPGMLYSANERLIYSCICYLLLPELITKLSVLLPPKLKLESSETAENLHYIKLSPLKLSADVYLRKQRVLQRPREIIIEHNARVKKKRRHYTTALKRIVYQQDIINEMVRHELVTDQKLKYQYGKSQQKFEILKAKFESLEEERKNLVLTLYPSVPYTPRLLAIETFAHLEEINNEEKESTNISSNNVMSCVENFDVGESRQSYDVESGPVFGSMDGTSVGNFVTEDQTREVQGKVLEEQNETDADNVTIQGKKRADEIVIEKILSQLRSVDHNEISTIASSVRLRSSSTSALTDSSGTSNTEEEGTRIRTSVETESYDQGDTSTRRRGQIGRYTDDTMATQELYLMDVDARLDPALQYLMYKYENYTLLPGLQDLPKLKSWYRKTYLEDGTSKHIKPNAMKEAFNKMLNHIAKTQLVLPPVDHTKLIDMKTLFDKLERIKANLTRELKLKQINLGRELFTIFNVDEMQNETDVRKFKRIFFALFPNREKDLVVTDVCTSGNFGLN